MDGIGGIIIGNLFRIPDDLLPRGYKGGGAGPSKIAYVVLGIGHSINNNDWVTKLDAQFIILDEPKGGLSLADMQAIQTINKAAASDDIDAATKKAKELIQSQAPQAVNGNYRISTPYKSLVTSAKANINLSTKPIPQTNNGTVGCASGVSIIFLRATGYQIVPGRDLEFGTSTLYSTLSTDTKNWKKRSTYTKAQPGDVIITATGKQAGHAGIVSDGTDSDGSLAIISNGSRGFRDQPETAGTIQQNYSISRWKEVASRNPTQTAAFEYIGPYT
jgi:hypothetical protein